MVTMFVNLLGLQLKGEITDGIAIILRILLDFYRFNWT